MKNRKYKLKKNVTIRLGTSILIKGVPKIDFREKKREGTF